MKLRNKETGEIKEVESIGHADSLKKDFGYQVTLSWNIDEHLDTCRTYKTLAELNAEWEDAQEEPKIDALSMMIITLTNFIENEPDKDEVDLEDCKSMLEKLKAWKRLKDKGFRFTGISVTALDMDCAAFEIGEDFYKEQSIRSSELNKDLRFLFGGKE